MTGTIICFGYSGYRSSTAERSFSQLGLSLRLLVAACLRAWLCMHAMSS